MSDERIDWSQLWYPGPRRVFSATELARAGGPGPSRTAMMVAWFNACAIGFALLQMAPPLATARLTALIAAAVALAGIAARKVWQSPSRRTVWRWSVGYALAAIVFGILAQWRIVDQAERSWVFGICWGAALLTSFGLWFLSVYRAEQVAGRLRELDEREHREDVARQLAQAQIQPHFLFNSLASLQHWVQSKDDRAALLLDALTGFLRATLPLFDRRLLRVGEEADAVRQYLTVMQLRLGERLRWQVIVRERAAAALLPPGLLLTLVENAIEHGVQQSLSGAEVTIEAQARDNHLTLEVRDSGPGLSPHQADGVGLGNARARLTQAFGAEGTLTLSNATPGGCLARIDCPLTTEST
jgi:hypothetical protein